MFPSFSSDSGFWRNSAAPSWKY